MSNPQLKILQQYIQLSNQNGATHVYRIAHEMGVFQTLFAGSGTLESIATACQAPVRPLQLLLNALCEIGVVQKFADDYVLAQVMQLLTSVNADLGDQGWQSLEDCLRPAASGQRDALPEDPTPYRARSHSLQWIDTPAAMELVQLLEIGSRRKGLRVLDLGSGSAVWSLAIAHHDPESEITAVDWPTLLETAEKAAASIGVESRFKMIAGDYWQVPIPPGTFDLVILANEILLYDDQQSQQLLHLAAEALQETGEIAILETVCCHEEARLTYALRELDLALHWPRGSLRTVEQLEQLVQAAGLKVLQYEPLAAPPHLTGLMLVGQQEPLRPAP